MTIKFGEKLTPKENKTDRKIIEKQRGELSPEPIYVKILVVLIIIRRVLKILAVK